jgi:quercetin dioxygenase-like cupin family protein
MSFPGAHAGDDRYSRNGALYVPAGEGVVKWVNGDEYTIKVTAPQSGGALGFVEAIVPPGGGPPAHAHSHEDETFYLLSGELEFLDGDRTFVARAGDLVFIPRHNRHRFSNISSEPARTLFLFTPGGMEDFFIEGGDDPQPGKRPEPWDVERFTSLLALADKVGMEVLPEARPTGVREDEARGLLRFP